MSRALLVAIDAGAAERLRRAEPSGVVGAAEADLHARLRDADVEHVEPWQGIESSDRAMLERRRDAVAEAIDRAVGSAITGIARYRHLRAAARIAWTLVAIDRMAEVAGADRIVAEVAPFDHLLDRPPAERRMPALGALAGAVARARGAAFVARPAPQRSGSAAPTAPSVAPADPCDAAEPAALAGTILFFGSGGDLLRQLPVIRALRARGARVVQVHRATDAVTIARLREAGHPLHSEEALLGGVAGRVALPPAGDARSDDPLVAAALPALSPHLAFLRGSYARSVLARHDAWRRRLRDDPPRAVVANYPAPPLDAAVAAGVPLLVLPHGPMLVGDRPYAEGLPAGAVHAAVSARHAANLRAWRPGAEVLLVGDPGAASIVAPAPRRSDGTFALLVLVQHAADAARLGAIPERDWHREREDLAALHALAQRRPAWRVVLRGHPRYDHDDAWYASLGAASAAWRRDASGTLAEAVAGCDAILHPSGRSSAMLEVAAAQRPAWRLADRLGWLDDEAWGIEAIPEVRSIVALAAEIEGPEPRVAAAIDHVPAAEATVAAADAIEAIASPRPMTRQRRIHA